MRRSTLDLIKKAQTAVLSQHKNSPFRPSYTSEHTLGLHILQELIFRHPARNKLVITGRRFGKTVLQIFAGLRAVARGAEYSASSQTVIVLAEPTISMARRLLFNPLKALLVGHPLVKDINKSELTINFNRGRNGLYLPSLVITGLNDGDGDRARGLKIGHLGGDEFQDWSPQILEEVLFPAMADVRGSTSMLSGTPKGKVNHTYKRFLSAHSDPDWAAFKFKSADNPYLDPKELERLKRILPPKVYAQELEADFVSFDGQIFDSYTDDWVVDYFVPRRDIILGIDWGDIHPAVGVVVRSPDGIYQVVDTWTNLTQQTVIQSDFADICSAMAIKWGVRHSFADPSRPAAIEEFRGRPGLRSLAPAFNPISEGLAIVNSKMCQGKFLLHKDCDSLNYEQAIGNAAPTFCDEIQGYHRQIDKRSGLVLDKVAPDQFDHRIDGIIRYTVATFEVRILKHKALPSQSGLVLPNWVKAPLGSTY